MKKEYEILFTPAKIGNVEIKNRFIQTAMGQTSLIGTQHTTGFNSNLRDFYINRAKDGVGLFIPGLILLYTANGHVPVWKHPEMFEGLSDLLAEIHSYGSKVFIQISAGMGRSNPFSKEMYDNYEELNKKQNLDAMLATAGDNMPNRWYPKYKSKMLTVEQIHEMVEGFGELALMVKERGADGVEIHAVHEGYLLDQFTLPYANNRTDEYGGSLENRLRFACEIVKSIKAKCGEDFPVSIRYSVTSKVRDFGKGIIPVDQDSVEIGRTFEESKQVVKILEEAGYDFFNADNGTYDSWYYAHPPVYMPENTNLKEVEAIKPYTTKPVACAGKMQLDAAADAIREGKIDFVGVARQFLTDEEYLTKIREDRLEDVRPCIACHLGCFAGGMWKDTGIVFARMGSCALNPYTFNEQKYAIKPAEKSKKIAVIGAGIAGCEFAIQAKRRGHDVTIYEKTDRIAGVFNEAASFSFKEKDRELIEYYRTQLKKNEIEVKFNCEVTNLDQIDAEEYVIATGATGAKKIPNAENSVTAVDYLKRGYKDEDNVVIIGGGLTGCEIAYELVLRGKHPVIIEAQDDILKVFGSCMANTSFLRDAFEYYKVPIYTNAKASEIKNGEVKIETESGEMVSCKSDLTIVSIGYTSGNPFDVDGKDNVHVIGDADHIATLLNAVEQANNLVISL